MGQRMKASIVVHGIKKPSTDIETTQLGFKKKSRYFPVTEIGKGGHANHGEECYQDALNS